jgi:uncharacterized protein YigE (DUF2233 family)
MKKVVLTQTNIFMGKKHKIFIIIITVLTIFISLILTHTKKNKTYPIHNIYEYATVKYGNATFDTAKIKPENVGLLTFNYKDKEGNKIADIRSLKMQKDKLIFATNGGIFSEAYKPLGLYIENGEMVSEINTSMGEGNFYLHPNGIFLIENNQTKIIKTNKYQSSPDISFAIQSGPVLIADNKINSSLNKDSENKYIRSGVGIDKDGNTIFAISNQPVNFYKFANFFKKELNCANALYLDGAISEMYIPEHREDTQEKFGVIIGITNKNEGF